MTQWACLHSYHCKKRPLFLYWTVTQQSIKSRLTVSRGAARWKRAQALGVSLLMSWFFGRGLFKRETAGCVLLIALWLSLVLQWQHVGERFSPSGWFIHQILIISLVLVPTLRVFRFLGLLGCFCKDWRVIGSIFFLCISLLNPSCFYQKHTI